MIATALYIAFGCIGIGLFCNLWRLVQGPTIADRILALDTMVINSIGMIILLGILLDRTVLFEAAILFAMVGFVSTVAYCKFVLRGDIIE
jgi:multicomponent K+:H+ antiporter subunit F